jgi:hypothetical protein
LVIKSFPQIIKTLESTQTLVRTEDAL